MLAGESACPTQTQTFLRKSGADAFVCQPGDYCEAGFTSSASRTWNSGSRPELVPLPDPLYCTIPSRSKTYTFVTLSRKPRISQPSQMTKRTRIREIDLRCFDQ